MFPQRINNFPKGRGDLQMEHFSSYTSQLFGADRQGRVLTMKYFIFQERHEPVVYKSSCLDFQFEFLISAR